MCYRYRYELVFDERKFCSFLGSKKQPVLIAPPGLLGPVGGKQTSCSNYYMLFLLFDPNYVHYVYDFISQNRLLRKLFMLSTC